MDEAEQDQYEARLKELFDRFDFTGSGSLGREELTDLCHELHLEEVAPGALQQTLLQDSLLDRVNFDQFKEALILILSRTLTNEEPFEEPDSSPEAQPKYIKGGKRYGRRSLPEFQEPVDDFAKVTVIEPLNEEAQPPCLSNDACDEPWQSQDSEEYEAEGQLRFWNPDDLNASPNISPTQDWIEEKLREVCENLDISRDGHLNREKLVSICGQYGLQNIDAQLLEEVFHNLEHDGMMSIEDFFYGLFKIGKPLPPSASTPYRQLKRHLSMQSFDESGRRNTTTSAMTTTISFRVFSSLDDGMGYAAVDRILDVWHEEGIENSHEILKALDFSLDGKVSLSELTLALENELLITKNGIFQAALASFKTEIRHLMERVDQVVREKEKLRLDLEKAEKLKSLMASEVDDHHTTIERWNEYNLRKLDEEYKDRVAVLRNELRKEREQILQQASKQRVELEQEIETLKTEENYLRDRLALTLKENSRLESELLETGEKLAKCESTTSKLQKNLENVLAEKFGDLDPSSAEFFQQEELLTQMKIKYEWQCRELQDEIDELQSQLEAHRSPGKAVRRSLKSSLFEELGDGGVESSHAEAGSEEGNPLNMSIEAEMVIEQMKDQHHQDVCDLQQELQNKIHHYEGQLEETRSRCEEEKAHLQQKFFQEMLSREQQLDDLQAQVSDLQAELAQLTQRTSPEQREVPLNAEEMVSNQEAPRLHHGEELQAQLEETRESFHREREELIHAGVWMEAKMRSMAQSVQEEKAELEHGFCKQVQLLAEKHALEKEQIRRELAEKHRQELQEERIKMESEFNGRLSQAKEQFAIDRQALVTKYGEAVKNLEERYQQELQELSKLRDEEKSRWEFEKEELIQEGAKAQERWKEVLEKEKSLSSVLAQEKELLEKNLKEHVNSLTMEKEKLQKEIGEAKKQEEELRGRLLQVQAGHQKELREREEEIEASRKQARRKLEELEMEFLHEREELSSRLVALEHSKEEAMIRASAEERELRSEVSKLESKVEELQRELVCLSELQSNCVLRSRPAEIGAGESPGETQGTREVRDNLPKLMEVQDPARDRDTAAVSAMGNLPNEPEEPVHSPAFSPLTPETFVESQLLNPTDEDDDEEEQDEMGEASEHPVVETEMVTSGEMMETCSDLKKAYEEIRSENEILKLQKWQLQERICLLEMECERAALERQDMASQVQKELDEILQAIPRPKSLTCGDDESEERSRQGEADVTQMHPDSTAENQRFFADESEVDLSIEEVSDYSLQLWKDHGEAIEEGELKTECDASDRAQLKVMALSEGLQLENQVLKAEVVNLFERNSKLESYLPRLIGLQRRLEESGRASFERELETQRLQEKVRELEEAREQEAAENRDLQSMNLRLRSQLGKLEEWMATLKALKGRPGPCAEGTKEAGAEKRGLQELNWKLKERVATLLKQNGTHAQEKDHLNAALRGLQCACGEQRQQLERWRCEIESLREENAVLREEIGLLNEEGNLSGLRLRELNGSRELWQKIETMRKEKVAAQKMAENLKKQVSELKARNQQLEAENTNLGQRNSPSQADTQDLNQQLLRALRQRERESGKCVPEEWEREHSRLKEELENCKIQSSTLVSSVEAELCQLRAEACAVEEENFCLKQELEKVRQVPWCSDLSHLQNEISSLIVKNEKLVKEREALSGESSRSTEKVSRLKSDLRVTQQENDALKQEVMSLHKQLQTANDKNRVLELATPSSGPQSQLKKRCREELDQRVKQEQQLLRQENERLQREVQSAKAELARSREKIQQLEATLLSLKHQKHQSPSGIAKAVEQEKLKRECEVLHKELVSASRKISQMKHELETIKLENEDLRKKQVKLDEQLMERLQSSASVRLSQSPHPRELQPHQPPGCAMVPWEQYQQLRHQLFQAERRSQRLQEELENQPLDTNMPQVGHEELLKTMEKRMMDVEQQLRLVKRLLQDKVNQLKEQVTKNTKADEMVKDLYVENAQLLKALEMTEQRQKTVEKKNYLLEEKIANLGRIVKNLTSPALGSAAQLGS